VPTAADDRATLILRFSTNGDLNSEKANIDNVSIKGVPLSAQSNPPGTSNRSPVFVTDPIIRAGAVVGQAFSSSVSSEAIDPDAGDQLTFNLTGSLEWLAIAADGTLSGFPSTDNVGENIFSVRVTDSGGLSDVATLSVTVVAAETAPSVPGSDQTDPSDTAVDQEPMGETSSEESGGSALHWLTTMILITMSAAGRRRRRTEAR
jgi:hypothetical protein